MDHLADSNILLRWVQIGAPEHPVTVAAVKALWLRSDRLFVSPQNLVEFWNVATRPISANGLGLTPAQADGELQKLESLFPLLPDVPKVHTEWRQLVVAAAVSGKQVHDARLVAVMRAHGLTHLQRRGLPALPRYCCCPSTGYSARPLIDRGQRTRSYVGRVERAGHTWGGAVTLPYS